MNGLTLIRLRTAAVLSAAALAGGTGGAAIYATTAYGGTTTPTTAAAQVVSAAATQSLTVSQIYAKDVKGVVKITASGISAVAGPFGASSGSSSAEGTGFVYDSSGDIVTNAHVVEGASTITVKLYDGTTYEATVVGADVAADIAVLHVDAPAAKLHALPLADSSSVQPGAEVVAIGNPFGLDASVTSGIVSAVGRTIASTDGSTISDVIQTDAALNSGNSGGPLLDMHGEVIGVTSQIETVGGGNDGIGFAISSNTVKQVVSALIETGT